MSRRGVASAVQRYNNIQKPRTNGLDVIRESETEPLVYSTIAKYGNGGAAESQELEGKETTPPPKIRTYKWRWVVLTLFFMNNLLVNYVWIMFAPVANLIRCYYNVSDTMVNLLSTSFMISYILMAVVVPWAMERYGLRVCVLLGSAVAALGASIKVAGSGKGSAMHESVPVVFCVLYVISGYGVVLSLTLENDRGQCCFGGMPVVSMTS